MKSWKPRKESLAQRVRTSAREALEGGPPDLPPIPPQVEAWLGQLALLYGVPFNCLVPDYRMLPAESIRFFHLDASWSDRLAEGALAIGPASTRDLLARRALTLRIGPELGRARALVRGRLRGAELAGPVAAGGPVTGFLLRSVAVSGWPGLEVRASQSGQPLPLLRMDTLAPQVLLVLFAGIPDEVQINEPPEGLHFGVRTAGAEASTFLRGLGYNADQYPAGQLIPGQTAAVPLRTGPYPGVLDVAQLAANLKAALTGLNPPAFDPAGTLTSCELAIEMVRGAGLQEFDASLLQGTGRAS